MNEAGLLVVSTFNTKYYLEDEVVLKSSSLLRLFYSVHIFLIVSQSEGSNIQEASKMKEAKAQNLLSTSLHS